MVYFGQVSRESEAGSRWQLAIDETVSRASSGRPRGNSTKGSACRAEWSGGRPPESGGRLRPLAPALLEALESCDHRLGLALHRPDQDQCIHGSSAVESTQREGEVTCGGIQRLLSGGEKLAGEGVRVAQYAPLSQAGRTLSPHSRVVRWRLEYRVWGWETEGPSCWRQGFALTKATAGR